MPERVELPRRGRGAAEHVALVADPVDRVADGRFGARQVRVRLVVRAADELEPGLGQELPDVRAILGIGVPVRLEVVELCEDELVVGVAPGHLEMRLDEREAGLLERRAVLDRRTPGLGVGRLRVPPDRVVVEVGDQVHPPAGFLDGELEGQALRPLAVLDDDLGIEQVARRGRCVDRHADLEACLITIGQRPEADRRLGPHVRALDAHLGGRACATLRAAQDDAYDLAGSRLGADEQVGRFDRDDVHRLAPAGRGRPGPDPSIDGVAPGVRRVIAEQTPCLVDRQQRVEVAGARP